MKEQIPRFLKRFSKESGTDKRTQTAAEILQARRETEGKNTGEHAYEKDVSEAAKEEVARLAEADQEIVDFENEFEQLSATKRVQLGDNAEIQRLRADLGSSSEEGTQDKPQSETDILTNYYKSEQHRWEESGVTWEYIDTYFSAEHLKTLSLSEYVKLLRRFPQEMVTHVSRRGIRDHNMLSEHDAGVGEFHDSFDEVLRSKHLDSSIGIQLAQDKKNQYVANEIRLASAATKEEAYERLHNTVEQSGWATFSDFSAVHFAAEAVADDYYGTERGNEHFIVLPSALIAAEYEFGGHYTDLSGAKDVDRYRNDVWVWSKEQEGMPIDAGIVFLPKSARVNPETGSRYELTSERKPMVNQGMINFVDALHDNPAFQAVMSKFRDDERQLRSETQSRVDSEYAFRSQEKSRAFNERYGATMEERKKMLFAKMENEFKVVDPRLQVILLHPDSDEFLHKQRQLDDPYDNYEHLRDQLVKNAGIYYLEAKETVPSEQFWETYFQKYPERRPSKIVFYQGNDPMEGLRKWREENGIVRTSKDVGINYQDRARKEAGASASGTRSRFETIAREVIEEHFARQETGPIQNS